jgi:DNA-binding Lrp family transcriptional regulator
VSGEFDIVTLVSAASVEEFSHFLKTKILKIIGVRSTVTSVVLNAIKGPRGSNGT